jgi:CDP-glycerol glycerophosphotransferase
VSPVLSVVVPFYNVEAYLEACLASLERQTLRDLEVIMVDDGSPDGSEAIAKRFAAKDDRFILVQQENQGLGPARNTGVRHATGEFLAFVDSDDIVPRYAYDMMVGSLRETGSDIVCGGVMRIGANGLESSPMHAPIFRSDRRKTHVRQYKELLNDRTAWNKVFRRSFWDKHAFAFPPGLYEDIPVTVPAHALAGTVDVLKETIYHWRIRETGTKSITQRRTEPGNLADRIRSVRSAADFLAANAPELKADYDKTALVGDVMIFINVLDKGDDAYRSSFFDLVNGYLDGVDPKLFRSLKAVERLKYHAVRNRMMDELVEIVRAAGVAGGSRKAAIRRKGRFRSHWYADLPYFGDPRFPDDLYELESELDIRALFDSVTWRDGRLRIEGWAFIDRLSAESPEDTKVQVELHRRKGPLRQIIKVDTQQVHRPEATASTWQPTACYDWSGFAAEIDPARLGSLTSTWRVVVRVTTHGVTRRKWLYGPKGDGWWPTAREVPGGRRVTPKFLLGNRLAIGVTPIRAEITGADLDGETVELRGWVRAEDAATVATGTLLVTTRQGATDLRFPLTAAGTADGRTLFQARVPLADLAREGEGPSTQTDRIDWEVYLTGPGSTRIRLAVEANLEGVRTTVGGHEYAIVGTRYGNLKITEAVPRLMVTEAAWRPRSALLTGYCTDPETRPATMRMRRRQSAEVIEFPVVWSGDTFTAEPPTHRGELPLPSGDWDMFVPGKGEVSGKADIAVCMDRPVAARRLPEPQRVGVHKHVLRLYQGEQVELLIEKALTPEETGKYAQRRLQRRFYGPANTAPLRDLVAFESYFGTQYSCNPKAIYEELARRDLGLDLVWYSADGQFTVDGPGRVILRDSTDYYETLSSAKVIVNNCLQQEGWGKRPGQFYVQTWHGTPYKHIAYDLVRSGRIASTTTRLERYEEDVPRWDLFVSPGPHVTGMFRSALRFTCDSLEVGYPRNDMLFSADAPAKAAEVRARLGIPEGRRVVLYVPTWREDVFLEKGRQAELMLDAPALSRSVGDGWTVLVRQHHLVADRTAAAAGEGVIDVTSYPDITELYLVADVVVTDYSSVMFDFAATGRPLLFLTPDLEYYQKDLRGTYFDLAAEAPGPLLRSTGEVAEALTGLDSVVAEHAGAYQGFRDRYCPAEQGHAAARVVDRIVESLG